MSATPVPTICSRVETAKGTEQRYGFYSIVDALDEKGDPVRIRQYNSVALVSQLKSALEDTRHKLDMIEKLESGEK